MKKDYEAGRYKTHTEAETEFRKLVDREESLRLRLFLGALPHFFVKQQPFSSALPHAAGARSPGRTGRGKA
jgi:hypothetical protein